ncbi:MAG: TonB-dependent receptor [Prevotella sp.]|nr:TonB-dependent receptor [Prevotella sp.]
MRQFVLTAMLGIAAMASAEVTNGELLADTSKVIDLDEVVVVSQPKESFRMRQQPLSSSMFSAADMISLNVRDLRELSQYVPSFTMPNYGSRYTSAMYVRGIGARENSPAVGMYVDGIPLLNKSQYNTHLYGVERVDILRGPQGTLYGMNTEGGLMRVYSKNPFQYQGTDVNLSFGTRMFRNAEVAHYNKVNDKFAFSVAGFYGGQNGFFKNQTTGNRADKYDEAGGKLRLMWNPTERLSLDFITDYQWVYQNAFPYGMLDVSTGEVGDVATTIDGKYHRAMLNTGLKLKYVMNGVDFYSTTSYQYLKDHMMMDIDYQPKANMRMGQNQLKNGLVEELVFKSNRPGIWQSVTGFNFSHLWEKTNAPVFFDPSFSEELSTTVFRSMRGAMMLNPSMSVLDGSRMDIVMGSEVPGLFRTPQFNFAAFHESNIDLTKHLTATLGLRYDYSHVKLGYATSGTMNLDVDLKMQMVRQMGGRTITVPINSAYQALITDALANTHSDEFNQLLPKVALTYKLNNGGNIYAVWSKGYRAGGYNIQMFSDILSNELEAQQNTDHNFLIEHDEAQYTDIRKTISYKPETSWNYEFGAHLNLLPNLKLDFSGFYTQVRDLQLTIMAGDNSYGRMMKNAGKSNNCGVELSLYGSLLDDHLTFNLSYGYTRAVFSDYTDSLKVKVGGEPVEVDGQTVMVRQTTETLFVDYTDKFVPYVPQHTLGAMADYRIDFNNSFLRAFTLGVNFHAQGKTYWDSANEAFQKMYALLGAHAQADFGAVALNVWARNITDTKYTVFGLDNVKGSNYIGQRGNPFQMGVDVNIHF